ncbi:MAG TPA: OmpH family outer membrane protein [Chitinophagaceae bacterium]|nr:OmpH family outer membrane protein [Chitinophagaceae bacterium]
MKKIISFAFSFIALLILSVTAKSQTFKIGVFDVDVMVQAMPGYRNVDSLMQIFDRDSLGALRDYYESEYKRLDSTYKIDSAQVAAGKKTKAILDMIYADRQKAMINILYWQQIAQNRSNEKRGALSQDLYNLVVNAYKKVLARKKYTLVLKPQTYEGGFKIDNIFIAVARELKLTELPQNLLFLGDDPDPVKQPTIQKPPVTKPKN